MKRLRLFVLLAIVAMVAGIAPANIASAGAENPVARPIISISLDPASPMSTSVFQGTPDVTFTVVRITNFGKKPVTINQVTVVREGISFATVRTDGIWHDRNVTEVELFVGSTLVSTPRRLILPEVTFPTNLVVPAHWHCILTIKGSIAPDALVGSQIALGVSDVVAFSSSTSGVRTTVQGLPVWGNLVSIVRE